MLRYARSPLGWRTNSWVKKAILLGFRMGVIIDMSIDAANIAGSLARPRLVMLRG
jgi:hypothetical protein